MNDLRDGAGQPIQRSAEWEALDARDRLAALALARECAQGLLDDMFDGGGLDEASRTARQADQDRLAAMVGGEMAVKLMIRALMPATCGGDAS